MRKGFFFTTFLCECHSTKPFLQNIMRLKCIFMLISSCGVQAGEGSGGKQGQGEHPLHSLYHKYRTTQRCIRAIVSLYKYSWQLAFKSIDVKICSIQGCFLHTRFVHRTFQPCWKDHHHALPTGFVVVGRWWTNSLSARFSINEAQEMVALLYDHQGAMAKLSVGFNLWKSVSRGNRTWGHQYAEH